eukprot:CAMPEP_0198609624 /NCGR_PEP_ID=MMETSP1462-20131121/156489_1 /TAXON_ID=1333877 /ORGANISM="Brandtodinium nutriculum, Strain RCC3387" /LENGTH=363 /DNA_ID=CAMNT_0044341429 /DNA_START=426 /DNA_END=1516 /DNA_ORIENTATION=-
MYRLLTLRKNMRRIAFRHSLGCRLTHRAIRAVEEPEVDARAMEGVAALAKGAYYFIVLQRLEANRAIVLFALAERRSLQRAVPGRALISAAAMPDKPREGAYYFIVLQRLEANRAIVLFARRRAPLPPEGRAWQGFDLGRGHARQAEGSLRRGVVGCPAGLPPPRGPLSVHQQRECALGAPEATLPPDGQDQEPNMDHQPDAPQAKPRHHEDELRSREAMRLRPSEAQHAPIADDGPRGVDGEAEQPRDPIHHLESSALVPHVQHEVTIVRLAAQGAGDVAQPGQQKHVEVSDVPRIDGLAACGPRLPKVVSAIRKQQIKHAANITSRVKVPIEAACGRGCAAEANLSCATYLPGRKDVRQID